LRVLRRLIPLVVLLLALGLVAIVTVGCGGGGEEEEATSTPGGAGTPSASPQPGQAKAGGKLVARLWAEPTSFDPHTEQTPQSIIVFYACYDNLLKLRWDNRLPNPKPVAIEPNLAKSWEQPDATTYIFHLNEGVKFQNVAPVNGREMTAEDVKYAFERITTPQPQFVIRSLFADVTAIEAVDKYTVKFTLSAPNAPFLTSIASPWAMVVPKEVVDQKQEKTTPVGTGPFIMKSYKKGEGVTLQRNPDYFKKGQPLLDEVDLPIILDSATALAAFRGGSTDIDRIGADNIEPVKRSNPKTIFYECGDPFRGQIDMNCTKPPFDDVRVRQAVMYATDPSEYIKTLFGGGGKQSGPLGALTEWALPDSELPQQDIEKAKALLAEAGVTNLKIKNTVTAFPLGTSMAPITGDQLGKAGIDTEIDTLEAAPWMLRVYFKSSAGPQYQMASYQHYGYADPDGYIYNFYYSKGSENNTGYSNPTLDDLLDKERHELDPAKRKEYLLEAQRLLIQDAPSVFIFKPVNNVITQPYVKAWFPQPLFAGLGEFQEMWLDK